MNKQPLLVVRCAVYNHEPYLRDCLEGFVMQKTNFPFVVVVHDDASTDNSAAIIREYAEKYPDVIYPMYETENQYSKQDGTIDKIIYDAMIKFDPKYMAECEGDDYWIDPYKLQKQIDFLESHPDYSMCCHGADVLNQTSRRIDCGCEHIETREYFPSDAFPTWQIPTASLVYRSEVLEKWPLKHGEDFIAGDVVSILQCMHVGRVWGMEDHMSVYRMHPGGATSHSNTLEDQLNLCKHYEAMMLNFPKIDFDYCHRYIAMSHYTNFRTTKDRKEKWQSFWKAFKNKPTFVIRKLLKLKSRPRRDLFYKQYGQ